jgi:Putative amidoligase enzyme
MNANDLTFGIEIETIAPESAVRDEGLRIGAYKRGIQVPYLPAGWKAERDGSINNGHGGHPCEIVSPILQGPDGLAQVAEVLKALETNPSTACRWTLAHPNGTWSCRSCFASCTAVA